MKSKNHLIITNAGKSGSNGQCVQHRQDPMKNLCPFNLSIPRRELRPNANSVRAIDNTQDKKGRKIKSDSLSFHG